MKIAVLGTGNVGATIGSKLIALGHQVMMGSRTKDNAKALDFVSKNPGAMQGTFAEAASFAELVINCTAGAHALEVLGLAGEKNLSSKVLLDLSNPLDFSKGMPPTLSVCNTDSVGELVQRTFKNVLVVKALNTMWCGLMVNPALIGGGDHQTFVCGNSDEAKKKVTDLLHSFGWKPGNIMDLGDITGSRGMEMYLPLWLRIYGTTKNGAFNIRLVS